MNIPWSGLMGLLCVAGWFAYDLGERWVVAQERVANAQVESCDVLADFRVDVRAVVDAHAKTSQTFTNWLNGSATVEDVTTTIASQGDVVEALQSKVSNE